MVGKDVWGARKYAMGILDRGNSQCKVPGAGWPGVFEGLPGGLGAAGAQ